MDALATQPVSIEKVSAGARLRQDDRVAVEEPLEIRIRRAGDEGADQPISVTMRTPGHDAELVLGFLYSEGLISDWREVRRVRHCGASGNVMRVDLRADVRFDPARFERHFCITSSCGLCGKTSIGTITSQVRVRRVEATWRVDVPVLHELPARLRAAQGAFAATGGLHAVGLFDRTGHLGAIYEDVGRHNALDKLVGARLAADALPLADSLLLLSGRASFELVQKAAAAGVPLVAAIGAPSSLAVDLARDAGMTLVAFLRDGAFNVYAHGERVCTGATV